MKRLVITGMRKEKADRLAREVAGDRLSTRTMSDYEGVVALGSGEADYFLGICQSGVGGAVALAVGMLGSSKCATVSMLGKPPGPGVVEEAVSSGKIVFGMAADHIDFVVPRLVAALLAQER